MFRATGIIMKEALWPDDTWNGSVLTAIEKAVRGTGPVARIGMVRRHAPEVYNLRNVGRQAPKGFMVQSDLTVTVNAMTWDSQVLLGTLEEVAAIMGVGPYSLVQGLGASGLFLTTDGTVRCKRVVRAVVSDRNPLVRGKTFGRLAWSDLRESLEEQWQIAWGKAQAQTNGRG